jgi:hypothetical protein
MNTIPFLALFQIFVSPTQMIQEEGQSRLSNAEITMPPIVADLYFGGKIKRAHIFLA